MDSSEFKDKILSLTVSPDIIAKYGFYAFDDMIKNSENVKLTYPKGDVYTGVVEKMMTQELGGISILMIEFESLVKERLYLQMERLSMEIG